MYKRQDNNSYGGDVAAGEIIVKYTYETVSNPVTTVIVSYTIDVTGNIKVDVDYTGAVSYTHLFQMGRITNLFTLVLQQKRDTYNLKLLIFIILHLLTSLVLSLIHI